MAKKPDTIEPIDATFDDVLAAVAPKATPIYQPEEEGVIHDVELVEYTDPGNIEPITFRLDPGTESIWATQAQIAQLFDTKQPNVSTHLKNIFEDGELIQESNIKKFNIAGSAKPVTAYSLDTVISVGYRVNSKAATRFRQWARPAAVLSPAGLAVCGSHVRHVLWPDWNWRTGSLRSAG